MIGDKTDYKLLLANENFSNKHLQTGNFIKILKPEISTNEEEEVTIKIGENTSIFSSPKIDGIVTPPEDDPLMVESVKEPTPNASAKIIDELKNSILIASTFGKEKCQVKMFVCKIVYYILNRSSLKIINGPPICINFFS